jgi:D-alanyl-D-alanine-carboxypeptidase/D-alanyl-D-alanine-endopeptidase
VRAMLLVAAIASTSELAAQSDPIDAMLADRLTATPGAGIVVGTIEGATRNLVVRGKAALDGDTILDISGLAEVFLATALADMVAKGELNLRDPVAKYLPGMPVPTWKGKSITLEDLAMHRSGLPRVLPGLARADQHRYAAYTPERLADFLGGYELTRDIGERYERSPLGIGLLAAAMTTRAATPLGTLLQDRVIAPLGLTATQMKAGALLSTPNDVLKFAAANLAEDNPLGSVFADMQSSRGSIGVRGESLGLGWRIRHSGPRQILWSSGAAGGHHAFIAVEPAAARGVVVLHNQAVSVDDIGFNVLEHVRESARPVDLASLAALAGEYEIKRGLRIVVRVAGRKLAVRVGDEPESTLTQDSELRFVFDYAEARITFVRDAKGVPIGLMLHRDGQHVAARRVR